MPSSDPQPLSQAEARIKRAFLRSAAGLIALAAIGLFIGWLIGSDAPEPEIPDAEIATPVAPPAATANSRYSTGAGGPDVPPALGFTDITSQAGIEFIHVNGAYGDRLMPETIGSGAAFFDYDRDGDQDLFLVNSREWAEHETRDTPPTQALYRNDGQGRFKNVTAETGLDLTTYGMGVAIGDMDGDGWPDLYLTSLNQNHLFRNLGNGRFADITAEAGVAGANDSWSSSAAFFDYDRDGDLDLFVVNYVDWSPKIDLEIDFRLTGLGRAYGAPLNFVGTNNQLYRNDGTGRFTDVSREAGILVFDPVSRLPVGKGLGVITEDVDGDGWIDLLVANDTVRNFLFRNRRDGTFEETGIIDGIAYDRNGKATSAMGIDSTRFDDSGERAVAIGNFANEMASLFVTTNGEPPFVDEAVIQGLGPASRIPLTFGLLFADIDLDGREDLLLANGHLEHEIHKVQQSQHYAQPPSLFWNCGNTCSERFVPLKPPEINLGDLSQPLVGRGISYADIDNDGDLDLLITQSGRRPALLRNDQQTGHHWLRLELVGQPPNTGAIGARVAWTLDGLTHERSLRPTRGYLSQVEHAVTLGLGRTEDPAAVSILITWPDGSEQRFTPDRLDTTLRVEQPAPSG